MDFEVANVHILEILRKGPQGKQLFIKLLRPAAFPSVEMRMWKAALAARLFRILRK